MDMTDLNARTAELLAAWQARRTHTSAAAIKTFNDLDEAKRAATRATRALDRNDNAERKAALERTVEFTAQQVQAMEKVCAPAQAADYDAWWALSHLREMDPTYRKRTLRANADKGSDGSAFVKTCPASQVGHRLNIGTITSMGGTEEPYSGVTLTCDHCHNYVILPTFDASLALLRLAREMQVIPQNGETPLHPAFPPTDETISGAASDAVKGDAHADE